MPPQVEDCQHKMDALETELQGSKAYGAVNDSPVTIAELRKANVPSAPLVT